MECYIEVDGQKHELELTAARVLEEVVFLSEKYNFPFTLRFPDRDVWIDPQRVSALVGQNPDDAEPFGDLTESEIEKTFDFLDRPRGDGFRVVEVHDEELVFTEE